MRIKYCKSCGHKNQFIGLEPKFCSSCGASFQKGTSQVTKSKTVNRQKLNEDETDVDFVPNIASLQYSVSPFEKKTFKMEEMFDLEDDGGNPKKKKR
jgi:uncharacterized membrane protein YvbJ